MSTTISSLTDRSPNCVSQGDPTAMMPSSSYSSANPANADAASFQLLEATNDGANSDDRQVDVSFSHVQLYVDSLGGVRSYKKLENDVNRLNAERLELDTGSTCGDASIDVQLCRRLYRSIVESDGSSANDDGLDDEQPPQQFVPQNRDVVRQLIAGLGFRITAAHAATCTNDSRGTRSVLLTTRDSRGVQIVVSALTTSDDSDDDDDDDGYMYGYDVGGTCNGTKGNQPIPMYDHFHPTNLERFFQANSHRQGIAVLAFEVTSAVSTGSGSTASAIDVLRRRYAALHPKLLIHGGSGARHGKMVAGPCADDGGIGIVRSYRNADGITTRIFEVYAYYLGNVRTSEADTGTVLRFVQRDGGGHRDDAVDDDVNNDIASTAPLPGLRPIAAVFDPTGQDQAAYWDHWVSNVHSRTGFLDTLHDVLGFCPKVDFNAGVVAAGEAQIESTVTGNEPSVSVTALAGSGSTSTSHGHAYNPRDEALRDRSQVYLPINNALSEVGHVHGFLEEIGQGIQHVASRVADLPSFVQRGNDLRRITGEGFTFLNIPRSYYGVLAESLLMHGIGRKGRGSDVNTKVLDPRCARTVMQVCQENGIVGPDGAVDLTLTRDEIAAILDDKMPAMHQDEYSSHQTAVLDAILHSRYTNLHSLLRDHLTEESYLKIVRNQILVDVQGDDLLLQIFTCNILQRRVGEEAPFLEFIQRVCSERRNDNNEKEAVPIKPGCGGFGIRNFLTLFLSIEVSKAMVEASQAKADGNEERFSHARAKVDLFTAQLDESNPILTEISDAMTLEGDIKMQLERAKNSFSSKDDVGNDEVVIRALEIRLAEASRIKADGNQKLMECSTKYKDRMRKLRESRV